MHPILIPTKRWVTVLTLILSSFTLGHAQDVLLPFHVLNQSRGLSNQLNAHFGTDREGYFWTSSRDGLNRFDGNTVRVFRPTVNEEPVDPNINSKVFMDTLGRRWFTSSTALHYLTPEQDSMVSYQFPGNEQSYYYAFYLEQDRRLWTVANGQLYLVDIYGQPDTTRPRFSFPVYDVHVVPNEEGKVTHLLRPIYELRKGLEMLRVDEQANVVQRDTFFTGNRPEIYPEVSFSGAEVESDTSVWLASTAGLVHFNPQSPRDYRIYQHERQAAYAYQAIALWQDRYVWVGTFGDGLLLFDRLDKTWGRQDTFWMVDGTVEPVPRILRTAVDTFGRLWASSPGNGLFFCDLNYPKFRQLFPLSSLADEQSVTLWSLIEHEGRVLLSTLEQGLLYASNPSNRVPMVTSFSPTRLEVAPDGYIWGLDTRELVVLEKTTNGLNPVWQAPIPARHVVWNTAGQPIVNTSSALYLYPGKYPVVGNERLLAEINLPAELYFDRPTQLLFLSQGDNTLRIFDAQENYAERSAIRNIGTVNDFCRSRQADVIWLASSTGLFQYIPAADTVRSLPGNLTGGDLALTGIEEDKQGILWLSSYSGIYRFDPAQQSWTHYTQEDGLLSLDFQAGVSLRRADGTIYFGSQQGVVFFHPDSLQENTRRPNLVLEQWQVNDQKRSIQRFAQAKSPSFSAFENDLTFHFGALEYTDPDINRFRYVLRGDNGDTLQAGTNMLVKLYSLLPGQYELLATVGQADAPAYARQETYFFTIRPPWYRTWWARLLGVVLFLAVVYAIYRFRVQQIARREAFKRQEAEFRQKEAEYKQLVAETETAVLRLQMNPHFIFNSMNSINAYILHKDIDQANHYLNRFASLMRMILELSEYPFTSLDEEVELLELYLQAEAMRLRKELHYTFEVDSQLDPEDTLIPTMLLQPFVENAIWHGISPKREGGHIDIGFRQNEAQLICTVQDNGVGRSASAKTSPAHQSKALGITQKRLHMLAQQEQADAYLYIDDLHHSDGTPAGTRVTVTLPLIS